MHSPADGPADSATQRDSPQLQPIPDHVEDPVPGINPNFCQFILPKDRTQAQPIQTLEGSMDKNADIHTRMEDDDFNESLYYLHTPNGRMRLRGCLSDTDDEADIDPYNEPLFTTPDCYLSDSVVTMLLFHTCWALHRDFEHQLIVISPIKFVGWQVWSKGVQENRRDKDAGWKVTKHWKKHKYIAFITHMDEHFTLGIAMNQAWTPEASGGEQPEWILFHFNSLPSFTEHRSQAAAFAAFAAEVDVKSVNVIEVPVPKQGVTTNNCGLCANLNFEIFFDNVDRSIEFCTKESIGMSRTNRAVLEFWQAERYSFMREDAQSAIKFYQRFYELNSEFIKRAPK